MLLPCSLDAATGQAQVARPHLSPSPPSLLPTQEFDILQNRMDGCRHPSPGAIADSMLVNEEGSWGSPSLIIILPFTVLASLSFDLLGSQAEQDRALCT